MNGWNNKYKTVIQDKKENSNLDQYYNIKNYFLLDSSNELQKYKNANPNEKGIIYLRYITNNEISENTYKLRDFLKSYDFYFIQTESEYPQKIGFLSPKNKLISQNKAEFLYNVIFNSPYFKEISRSLHLDLNNGNYILNENKDNLYILTKHNGNNKNQGNNDNIFNNNPNEISNNNKTVIRLNSSYLNNKGRKYG